MITPINERCRNLSNILHLTTSETSALNQAIIGVSSSVIGDSPILLSFSKKPFEFLRIHQNIELVKNFETLNPLKNNLLEQINEVAQQFEQIVLQTTDQIQPHDSKEIQNLYRELKKLKNDPLLKNGTDENTHLLYKELTSLATNMKSLAASYREIAFVRERVEHSEEVTDQALMLINDQREALEKGESDFTITHDLSVLDVFNKLVQLYKKFAPKQTLSLYLHKFLANLTEQARVIRFNREDYCTEYQEAVSVEVLKTLKALQEGKPNTAIAEKQHEILLRLLIQTKGKIEHSKSILDYHLESFENQEVKGTTEKLFQEFSLLQRQLQSDLKFLEKQVKMLNEKQKVGWWGRWTIHSRNKQVEHHVRKLKEQEVEKPAGIGQKLLSAFMWGLYLTPQIHSLASFANQTYKSFATGESPLKEQAELLSTSVLIQHANEMPKEKQSEVSLEMSSLQGVLGGFIPFTASFIKQHPAVSEYVKSLHLKLSSSPSEQLSGPNANLQQPLKVLTPQEIDYHALKFLGGQVLGYYETIGELIPWKNPHGSLPSWNQSLSPPEEDLSPPKQEIPSLYVNLAKECVEAIKDGKSGVLLEENVKFNHLQEQVEKVFGTKLPHSWFETWILDQEWNPERLDQLQEWLARNLEVHVNYHIIQQSIHTRSENPNVIPLFLSESPHVKEPPPHEREFKIIEPPLPIQTSDKTLLHQFGDFFGQNTGLEGFNRIEAFKFYAALISDITMQEGESEHLERMQDSLKHALTFSKLLEENIDEFRNQFKSALKNLEPNASIFLPGGLAGWPSGHAVVYEMIKQSDQRITFRIYNTGSGTEYHPSETVNLKEKIVPYIEISDVPIEKVLERPFLRAWQIMGSEIDDKEPWQAKDMYESLMKALGGTIAVIKYGQEDLMTPQRSGTCAFMSLTALFYHLSQDKKIVQKTHFQLLSSGIHHYVIQNTERLYTKTQAQNLFSKSLEEYSRITAKLFEDGILNSSEFIEAGKRIEEYRVLLKSAKEAYQNDRKKFAPTIDLNKEAATKNENLHISNATFVNPNQIAPRPKVPLLPLSIKNWIPKQKKVLSDLTSFVEVFKQGTKDKSHLSVMLNIQTLVQKLDLTTMKFHKEDTLKLVAQLHTLGFLYYENIQRSCQQRPEMHCQLVTPTMHLTLNALLFQASRLLDPIYEKSTHKDLIINYFSLDNHRALTSPYIRFMDPKLDEQFRQIGNYSFSAFSETNYKLTNENREQVKFATLTFRNDYEGLRTYSPNSFLERSYRHLQSYFHNVPSKIGENIRSLFKFFDNSVYESKEHHHQRSYFPEEFYQLHELSLLSLALENLPISLTSISNDTLKIETKARFLDYDFTPSATFHSILPIDNEYSQKIPKNEDLSEYHLHQVLSKFHEPLFHNILINKALHEWKRFDYFENRFDSRYYIRSKKYTRKTENGYLVEIPPSSFSLQKYRSLSRLAAKNSLQIKETLSYFNDHPALLADPEYQLFFINLMFTPGLLLKELKRSQGLVASHLANFITRNFTFYKNLGDLKTAAFFLQMNRLFKAYSAYAEAKSSSPFLNTRSEIHILLKQENLDEKTKWLLNKELALSYSHKKNLTHTQAKEFLSAVCAVNTHFDTGYYDEKWNRLQIEELLQRHEETFIQLTNSENKNSFLNSLAAAVFGDSSKRQWEADPAYPYFKTSDGAYEMDLSSGTLNSETKHRLPEHISKHPDVFKIFKEKPPKTSKKIGKNGFQVSFEGFSYQILQNNREIIIQKEFTIEGKQVWGQYAHFSETPLPKWLELTSRIWLCETTPATLALTNEENKIIAHVDNKEIRQVNPKTEKETGLILERNLESSLLNTLWKFEQREFFAIWADQKTNLVQEIDFPRFGFTFKRQIIDGKQRMASTAFPGFYLAETQYVEDLQNDSAFLLLENTKGEQQAILARQFFIRHELSRKAKQKALKTNRIFPYVDSNEFSPHLAQQFFYQYKINPLTNKLEASSLEASFYLSLRYLWKMRYEDTETQIRRFDAFLRPYSPEEKEILNQIVEIEPASGDQDPRCTALSLYAGYLLKKNSVDFETEDFSLSKLSPLYSTYLNQLNNLYGVRLSQEEELFLLNSFSHKSLEMVNRWIDLNPEKGKIAQAQLSQEPILKIKKEFTPSLWKTDSSYSVYNNLAAASELLDEFKEFKHRKNRPFLSPLRAKFTLDIFKSIDELIQTQSPTDKQKEFYQSFTGLVFPEKDIDWKKELASTLRLMTATPNRVNNTLACLLLAAVEYPKSFSLKQLIKYAAKPNESGNSFNEYYENTLALTLRSLYLESSQTTDSEKSNNFDLESAPPLNVKPEQPIEPIKKQRSSLLPPKNIDYQHSIALKNPLFFELPLVARPRQVISIHKQQGKENTLIEIQKHEKLQETFSSVSVKDPVIQREMNRIANSINQYRLFTENKEEKLSLTSLEDLKDYSSNISKAFFEAKITLRNQELDILSRINKRPSDPVKLAQKQIIDVGQSREPMTIDDVIHLFWNRDAAKFHEHNPNLTVEEIHQLEFDIQAMLIQATYMQQLNRVLKQIELIQNDPLSQELHEQLKLLKTFVEAIHAYDIAKHPEYLVIEYYADILLRPEQVKNLDLLQIRDGKIHNRKHLGTALEMIMGGGKTTVLLPLLAILNADGDKLSIGVLPSALLPSMADMLAERLGTSFKQTVEVVSIERETPINQAFLTRLQNIRRSKKLMLMTDGSLQSLFLNGIEFFNRYSEASQSGRLNMEKEREVFQEIFQLLHEHSSLVIDEVDQILNPRTEKQYTLGGATTLPKHEVELVTALYELLESHPSIANTLHFEFSPESTITTNKDLDLQKPFLQKTYEEVIKPLLIEKILQNHLYVDDLSVIQFFKNLTQEQKNLIKEYLSSQSNQSMDFVSKQIPIIKDLLALAKEEIQNLLPLTCTKLSYQNYGPSQKVDYAIPFHGSDTPAKKSEFGTPYEILNYSIQLLIKQGVNKKLISTEIDALRNKALEELKENKEKNLEDTSAYQEFLLLVDGDKTIPLFSSHILDKVQEKINRSLKLKLQFFKKYIAPQIRSFTTTISANPQMYNFLFSIVNAFTGTQWNADTFPEGLKIIPDEIITGKTLGLLWNNRQEPIQVIKTSSPNHIIQELIEKNPQALKAHALIDTAGMIRGISREDVARQMLKIFQKQRTDIKGVVFYDDDNNLMILEKGKKTPLPLSTSKLLPHERFTFYDQKHTSGSDINQALTATAIVTIGRHTLLRDLLQSVWRLRGLDKSQKIQFLIDEEIKELIINTLKEMGITVTEPIQLEHLLIFASYNQAMLQGDNNFRSLKHKTWAVLQEESFKAFRDRKLDGDQLAELFKSVRHLFIHETLVSPWGLFGAPTTLVSSDLAVKEQVEGIKESQAFKLLTHLSPQNLTLKLNQIAEKTVPLLPSKLFISNTLYGREVEAEMEKETEIEKEVEIEKKTSISFPNYKPREEYPFEIKTLEEAFTRSQGLESFADLFDSDLYGTTNLFPPHDDYGQHPPFKLFNEFQKPICGLTITSDNQVIMIDQIDDEDIDNLYDLNLGLYRFEKEPPNFLKSEQFLRKVIQAKFFNGNTYYSEEEKPLLSEWIQEKGAGRLRELFVNYILKYKEESRVAFPNSYLDKILS